MRSPSPSASGSLPLSSPLSCRGSCCRAGPLTVGENEYETIGLQIRPIGNGDFGITVQTGAADGGSLLAARDMMIADQRLDWLDIAADLEVPGEVEVDLRIHVRHDSG